MNEQNVRIVAACVTCKAALRQTNGACPIADAVGHCLDNRGHITAVKIFWNFPLRKLREQTIVFKDT